MWIAIILLLGCSAAFILFKNNSLPLGDAGGDYGGEKLSIIIPARNEEKNLPHILQSLYEQTLAPYEIIVVNDHSSDRTRETALSFGAKVIDNPELPLGWTGKTWAVWNGYLHASGDVLVFLDADIQLCPQALEILSSKRRQLGGVISVVPYHVTKKFYERLALIINFLGVFSFTSPFEKQNKSKGLYGSCIIASRDDYEKVNGHYSIQSELLDDLTLGAKFMDAGVPVNNFIGKDMVSFRMYPHGIKSELEGFSKGAILSTSKLSSFTLSLVIVWLVGLIVSDSFLLFLQTEWFVPLLIGYLLYTLQIVLLVRFVGHFGVIVPIIHFISMLFFLAVIVYSVYQVVFLRHVTWKGRKVKVGRKESL